MALTAQERSFWEAASAAGYSDDEIASRLKAKRGVPRETSTPAHVSSPGVSGTKLNPLEEAAYQKWKATLPPGLQYEGDYDLRGFYRENPNFSVDQPGQHMTDKFKLPNHDTFSNESQYYNDKTASRGGHWEAGSGGASLFVPNERTKRAIVEDAQGERVSGGVRTGPRGSMSPFGQPDEDATDIRPPLRDRVIAGALKDDLNYLPLAHEGHLAGIKRFATDVSNVATGTANTVSAGALNAFNDALGLSSPQLRQETIDREPAISGAARMAGAATGVGGALAKSATNAASAIGKRLPEALPGVVRLGGRLLGGASAGALASGGTAASEAAFAGKTPYEVFTEFLDASKTGALFGLGGQAVAEGAGAIARGIRGTKAGQARTLTEQNAGRVTLRGGQEGIPELEGVEPTRRNMGEVQRQVGREIGPELNAEFERRYGNTYRQLRAEAEAPGPNGMSHADLPVDLTPMHNRIAQVAYSEKTPRHVAAYLKSELDRLDEMGWKTSWRNLEDMKQRYQAEVKRGVPGGPGTGNVREQSLQEVANAATELSAQGPYAEANKVYAEGMGGLRHDRALMGLKPKGSLLGESAEKPIGRWAGRLGEDTATAGLSAPEASGAEFKLRHPELGRTVDMPALLRAKADLQLGAPSPENLVAAATGMGRGHQMAGFIGHNAGALGARSLHLIEPLAQPPVLVNRLVAAAQQKRLEDQYTIESIFGRKTTDSSAPQPGQ